MSEYTAKYFITYVWFTDIHIETFLVSRKLDNIQIDIRIDSWLDVPLESEKCVQILNFDFV